MFCACVNQSCVMSYDVICVYAKAQPKNKNKNKQKKNATRHCNRARDGTVAGRQEHTLRRNAISAKLLQRLVHGKIDGRERRY